MQKWTALRHDAAVGCTRRATTIWKNLIILGVVLVAFIVAAWFGHEGLEQGRGNKFALA